MRSSFSSPGEVRGSITLVNVALILVLAAGVVYAAGAFLQPGASWIAWGFWGVGVWALLGSFFGMVVPAAREGIEALRAGKRDEALGSFVTALAFALAVLAGLTWLGYRLHETLR